LSAGESGGDKKKCEDKNEFQVSHRGAIVMRGVARGPLKSRATQDRCEAEPRRIVWRARHGNGPFSSGTKIVLAIISGRGYAPACK
jgi:hypothetical protein